MAIPEIPETERSDTTWAKPVTRLKVDGLPDEATNINVAGRQLTSPIQGFGQMWQKTYRVRLSGVKQTPVEVMRTWKEHFQDFQPKSNHFYPTMAGIKPGEVLMISAKVPALPGTPSILPVMTGVLILYVDEESFTVMTPEGHPEAGWNTFSVLEEDGTLVAQVQSLCRPSDPMYEFFNRYLGSSSQQEQIWTHVLTQVAEFFGVKGQVTLAKVLVDERVQWSYARNIWQNAGIRTVFYLLAAPLRWIQKSIKKKPTQ